MNVEAGQRATRTLAVTSEMVEAFAGITGDYNPLHFDEEFATAPMRNTAVSLILCNRLTYTDCPMVGVSPGV